MTPVEIAKAVELWAGGGKTLEDISLELGRSKTTLIRLYQRLGVSKGSLIPPTPVAPPELSQSEEEQALRTSTIKQVKQYSLQLGKIIQGLTYEVVKEALAAKQPMGTRAKDFAAFKTVMEIIKIRREEAYVILEVEKFDNEQELENLPTLDVREVSYDEVMELVANQQVDEFGATDIENITVSNPGSASLDEVIEQGGD